MTARTLAKITGYSYLIIFFAAIFANFFVLEAMIQDPLTTVQQNQLLVRLGIMAFLITVAFDVVVAWALLELFKDHHLSKISTYFRIVHAVIMGVAVFALPAALQATSDQEVLTQVNTFNTVWLIALFFFGIHLILLGNIIRKPKLIAFFLILAGIMYMVDTTAHIMLPNYAKYAQVFLAMVAIPSIVGEMAFAVWLLVKGGQE